MEASEVKVHDIPKLNFLWGQVASLQLSAVSVWSFLSPQRHPPPRPVMGPSPRWLISLDWCNPSLSPSPGALSALSEVGEALGCREGVGLQGEEVLLRQEEAGVLRRVRGLMELQLGVWRRVLEASRQWGGWRGGVRRRWRRRQSLRGLSGSGGWRGDGGGHQAAVMLLLLLTSDGEPPHGAAAPGRAGAGGGRAGLSWRSAQARGSRGEDHGDGFTLAAAQGEANGLLGRLLGPQASAAVDGHQGADDDEGDEDTSHHEEGDVDGLWGEQTDTD